MKQLSKGEKAFRFIVACLFLLFAVFCAFVDFKQFNMIVTVALVACLAIAVFRFKSLLQISNTTRNHTTKKNSKKSNEDKW